MNHRLRTGTALLVLLVIAALLGTVPRLALAQTPTVTIEAAAGFDGLGRADTLLPVRVLIENNGPEISGELVLVEASYAGGMQTDIRYAHPVLLPTHSRKVFWLYTEVSSGARGLDLELLSGKDLVARTTCRLQIIDPLDNLYGVLSDSPSDFNFLSGIWSTGATGHVAHLAPETLPPDPRGWEELDVLVLNDTDSSALNAEQVAALQTWVSFGGQLVVGGGAGAARTAAAVADLLPVTLQGTRTVQGLPALEEYLRLKNGEDVPVAVDALVLAETVLREGQVVVAQDGLPVVATRTQGAGRVIFTAFDAGRGLFSTWDGAVVLWSDLLGQSGGRQSTLHVSGGYAAQQAIRTIPGLALPSTLQLVCFLLVYVLLVGPVNYLVLRKLDRREWAWISIPALILGFSACAYLTGFQARGRSAIVHQLSIVEVPAGSSVGRASQLVGLFSPRRTRYDVRVDGAFVHQPPESGSYYYYYDTPPAAAMDILEEGGNSTVRNLRVDIGGLQPFAAEGYVAVDVPQADLQLQDSGEQFSRVTGQVHNGGVALEDAVLLVGSQALRLDTVAANASKEITMRVSRTSASYAVGAMSGFMYGTGGTQIADTIMGPGDNYSDADRYRRYTFLQSVFETQVGTLSPGVYLIGWGAASPFGFEVDGRAVEPVGSTLYVYRLSVDNGASGLIVVPSSLVSWEVESTEGSASASDEGFYLYAGAAVELRFNVWAEALPGQVDELLLTVDGSSGSGSVPGLQGWNWDTGQWEALQFEWNRPISMSPAAAFITGDGIVRIRFETASNADTTVDTLRLVVKGH